MAAPKNNKFWTLRSKHGRDKLFASPQLLWQAACEYFQWVTDNPLYETKAFAYQGEVTTKELPRMRAMTLEGLCFYLHCAESYFRVFKMRHDDNDDFVTVITDIETVIRTQKFEGAAADLLNPNIIARDLGLMDKQAIDVTTDLSRLTEDQIDKIALKLYQNEKGK